MLGPLVWRGRGRRRRGRVARLLPPLPLRLLLLRLLPQLLLRLLRLLLRLLRRLPEGRPRRVYWHLPISRLRARPRFMGQRGRRWADRGTGVLRRLQRHAAGCLTLSYSVPTPRIAVAIRKAAAPWHHASRSAAQEAAAGCVLPDVVALPPVEHHCQARICNAATLVTIVGHSRQAGGACPTSYAASLGRGRFLLPHPRREHTHRSRTGPHRRCLETSEPLPRSCLLRHCIQGTYRCHASWHPARPTAATRGRAGHDATQRT